MNGKYDSSIDQYIPEGAVLTKIQLGYLLAIAELLKKQEKVRMIDVAHLLNKPTGTVNSAMKVLSARGILKSDHAHFRSSFPRCFTRRKARLLITSANIASTAAATAQAGQLTERTHIVSGASIIRTRVSVISTITSIPIPRPASVVKTVSRIR